MPPTVLSAAAILSTSFALQPGGQHGGPSGYQPEQLIPDQILLGFERPDAGDRWITVNDNVMGGRSSGGPSFGDGVLTFSGSTNTNGGGFSSIRTRPGSFGLDDAAGLLLRVRGDGRTFIASLNTDERSRGFNINYWARFETSGDGRWQTVRIPFDSFIPTFMGEDVTGRIADLDRGVIDSIGLYIYDKEDGDFRLDVDWIGSFAADSLASEWPETETHAGGGEAGRAMEILTLAIDRGVPRFNHSQHGACADIYEVAIRSLVSRPGSLPTEATDALSAGLDAARRERSDTARAWVYRKAMDTALARLAAGTQMAAMDR